MPTHETTDRDRAVIAKYLIEAHGKERQLETALQAQIAVADRPGVEHALRDHLDVTRQQIRALDRRIDALGSEARGPVLAVAGVVAGAAASVANVGLALAKGPLVLLRGTSRGDRELRMVRDCYWNEAEEIAHYRVIETLADALGDADTAKLARRHREQEEQMQRTLEGQLPAVIRAVVAQETPKSEQPAPATPTPRPRRTSRKRAAGAA